ncbi:peptidoglycan-binding protein [Rhizobium sp. G187]|uniref:peptidoglycan-binding protein n=1 Tax=Rhizobium sp. G187 TaxID=3451352 RepID=UPI003EE50118
MNGSRSPSQRPGGTSSLDALSRTIEGLEARIGDLMEQSGRRREEPAREMFRRPDEAPRTDSPFRPDPLREIRERQRALEESRNRLPERPPVVQRATDVLPPQTVAKREPLPQAPVLREPAARDTQTAYAPRQPMRSQERETDFAHALIGLRQDLKKDIADSLSREVLGLREEMRSIRALAEDSRPNDMMRADIARLADGIQHLDASRTPGTDGLREDFNALRSLMDGLAREDSVERMERRWNDVEVRLDQFDPDALREEILRLADRLDSIKAQLGGMADSGAIRMLEDKLVTVASALEQISAQMDPNERLVMEQFAGLDIRLDEISRAIAASRTNTSTDPANFQRLEERLVSLAMQIEDLAVRPTSEPDTSRELADRLEILAERIEQLSAEQSAARIEERIDQLSLMLEQNRQPSDMPELTGYLADISRKIDAFDHGSANDRLADRLEILARRIEELDMPAATATIDDSALRDLEGRLNAVVDRLEESHVTQPGLESASLRGLEEQIAHLSALISQPSSNPDVSDRIAALEDYVATSDEYIIEAARQAAETVMANFSQYNAHSGSANSGDITALSALAEHLKQLEDYSRHSEERTHRTFEALHDTLVQIAGRLDELHESAHHDGGPAAHAAQPAAPQWSQPAAYAAPAVSAMTRLADEDTAPQTIRQPEPEPVVQPSFRVPEAVPAPEPVQPVSHHPIDEELLAAADEFAQSMTALPVIEAERQKAETKPSLLAGLGRKILPGRKDTQPPATPKATPAAAKATGEARTFIEPSPSIDPVDVLPQDDANELLEPGSGAPDVRKILERVRASQQAQSRQSPADARDADRTDYIAAARRAAQAAAMEMNRAQKTGTTARASAEDKVKDAGKGAEKTSLFGRYRRPILIAVGAILLAAMAMPLVNTFMQTPAPALVEEPAVVEPQAAPAETGDESGAIDMPAAGDAGQAETNLAAASPKDSVTAPIVRAVEADPQPLLDGPATVNPAAVDTLEPVGPLAAASTLAPIPQETVAAPAKTAASETVAAPAAAAADVIEVPAAITPASLVTAAKRGDAAALFEIGARYTDGRGVPNDFAEAAKWYRLAADRGFALAQYRLANFLEKGTGVAPDPAEAKRYYELAAASGNTSAMHNLAVMYASGRDGTQDYAKALEWFTSAAEHGVSDSQFNLAILLARGNGASQDLAGSYKWFAIAAKGGDTDAAQKRDEVAGAMQPDQLARAKAEVEAWKAKPLDPDANSANMPDEWSGQGLKTSSVDMKKAVRNIQAILNKNGFDAGTPDGLMGEKTVSAIKAFQTSVGQAPTGQVDDKLVSALLTRNK